jgi:septal ring factor EnvC (AmiA/AmiB activator)
MEATEVDEFSSEMKEGREKNMRHVSLSISVLAVLVAMVTVLGHRTHTEAVLSQTRAADQWNEYQAKKIRQGQISVAADLLSLQPSANDAAVQHKLSEYNAHLKKWNDDLNEEQGEAQKLESEVKLAEQRASRFDLAEALLEIAVVLSSITLLTQQHSYFIIGLALGIGGLLIAASAFLLHF